MNDNDKKEFAKLLWMFANDAGVEISKEQLSIKFETLKHFSIKEISMAANHLLHYREKTWPALPAISEFTKVIDAQGPNGISIDEKAEMQAVEVLKQLKYEGSNWDVKFEDKITQSIMTDRWSYHNWAQNVLESELKWWKKDFIILYKSYAKHESAGLLIEAPGGKMISSNKLKQLSATKKI